MQRLNIQGGRAHGGEGQAGAGDTGPHVPDYRAVSRLGNQYIEPDDLLQL